MKRVSTQAIVTGRPEVYGTGSLWQWRLHAREPDHADWCTAPDAGWREAMVFEGSRYPGVAARIFDGLPFADMQPNWTHTHGRRGLAVPGMLFVLYLPEGGGTNASALFNGTTRNGSGGDESLNDGRTFRGYSAGSSLTLRLARARDITGIRTFAGHPDGRASQNYTVLIARVANPAKFERLTSASVRCDGGASELRVKAGATDVVAVRFEFQDGPLGFNVYREINLVGQPPLE